jgi:hypothetical protein
MNDVNIERVNALNNQLLILINNSEATHIEVQTAVARLVVEVFIHDHNLPQFINTLGQIFQYKKSITPEPHEVH